MQAKKKVLILTYYWPPAGGPGVQRWLKFVKYLPEYGIEPVVFIPKNPNYPIVDTSLLSEVSDDITIIRQPIFEPYKIAGVLSKKEAKNISSGLIAEEKNQSWIQKIMLYIRGNFFIPDARIFWVKPSVKFLKDYVVQHTIQTIITTGPPHSVHLIGLQLKQQLPLKWIADFRDPWTSIGYQDKLKLSKKSVQKHKKLEKEVLQTADEILTTSFATKQEFEQITPQPITVITNGFDEENLPETRLDQKFTIAHIGSLLAERNPKHLWQVFKELLEEDTAFRTAFRLHLVGKVSSVVLDTIKDHGLENYTHCFGYVSHEEAIVFQQQSHVLLLLEIDSPLTRGIIPGKVFEYMRSQRPILAVGPSQWDVATLISSTQTGTCFLYSEKEKMKSHIKKLFIAFQQGSLKTTPVGLDKFTRKTLSKTLSQHI